MIDVRLSHYFDVSVYILLALATSAFKYRPRISLWAASFIISMTSK